MRLLDRYLIKELIPPLLFGVAIFTTLLLAGGVLFRLVRLAMENALPFPVLLKLFTLSLPRWLVYALPLSTLLSGLLGIGRLSGDLEITAIRAAGISLRQFLFPLFLMGTFMSLTAFTLQEALVPLAREGYEHILQQWLPRQPQSKKHFLLQFHQDDRLYLMAYAEAFRPSTKTLEEATVIRFGEGGPSEIIKAERAVFEEESWLFYRGLLQQFGPRGELLRKGDFAKQRFDLPFTYEDALRLGAGADELNIRQLRRHIAYLAAQGADVRPLWVDYHFHFSLPFAALVFAFLSLPLALLFHRQSNALGVGLSALVSFLYYVVMSLTSYLGKSGAMGAQVCAWAPNLLFFLLGIWLFRTVDR